MKSTDESSTHLIDACIACAKMCHANAAMCKDKAEMEDCYHICLNCAEACEKVVVELKGNSESLTNALDQCAHVCSECSKECAKHDNNHCKECSDSCLKCSELCSTILGQEQVSKLQNRFE